MKKELATLKVQKLNRPSLPKIRIVRKDIAKVLTVINAQQRQSVRAFYAGKKYIPKELRPKQTRAIRRRLSKEEKNLKTAKAKKAAFAYPAKDFAIKA